jgi:GNAT superfamily N-acetyltransferase
MRTTSEPILTAADDLRLGAAVQDNLHALFRSMAAHLGGTLQETETIHYHLTAPSNPMFKGVWRTRMTEADADSVISETLAWFQSQGAPYLFWWTGMGDTPADIGQRLLDRGLQSYEAQMATFAPGIHAADVGAPSMACDLHRVDETLLTKTPSGYRMDTARTLGDLLAFKEVFMASYGVPEWAAQAWVDATLETGIEDAPWTIFVGRQDGIPVAITILFKGAGVASVYGVGTIPSARGRGIGAAITLKPLLDARAQGYRYGVLFATEMGVSVYKRIGFRVVPGRINRFLWRKG